MSLISRKMRESEAKNRPKVISQAIPKFTGQQHWQLVFFGKMIIKIE
jgi:hypothetical protein